MSLMIYAVLVYKFPNLEHVNIPKFCWDNRTKKDYFVLYKSRNSFYKRKGDI